MYKKTVVADLHRYGPHEVKVQLKPEYIGLGDLVDYKNCKKKDIQHAKNEIDLIYNSILVKSVGGNHELHLKYFDLESVIVDEMCVFTHGDMIKWDRKYRSRYYQKNVPGASKFKRALVNVGSKWRHLKKASLDHDQIIRAIRIMNQEQRYFLVMGHTHSKQMQVIKNGLHTIVLMPRGLTTFMIEKGMVYDCKTGLDG